MTLTHRLLVILGRLAVLAVIWSAPKSACAPAR